jgi:hypothetical protein
MLMPLQEPLFQQLGVAADAEGLQQEDSRDYRVQLFSQLPSVSMAAMYRHLLLSCFGTADNGTALAAAICTVTCNVIVLQTLVNSAMDCHAKHKDPTCTGQQSIVSILLSLQLVRAGSAGACSQQAWHSRQQHSSSGCSSSQDKRSSKRVS